MHQYARTQDCKEGSISSSSNVELSTIQFSEPRKYSIAYYGPFPTPDHHANCAFHCPSRIWIHLHSKQVLLSNGKLVKIRDDSAPAIRLTTMIPAGVLAGVASTNIRKTQEQTTQLHIMSGVKAPCGGAWISMLFHDPVFDVFLMVATSTMTSLRGSLYFQTLLWWTSRDILAESLPASRCCIFFCWLCMLVLYLWPHTVAYLLNAAYVPSPRLRVVSMFRLPTTTIFID
jgi:hypothetical protein